LVAVFFLVEPLVVEAFVLVDRFTDFLVVEVLLFVVEVFFFVDRFTVFFFVVEAFPEIFFLVDRFAVVRLAFLAAFFLVSAITGLLWDGRP